MKKSLALEYTARSTIYKISGGEDNHMLEIFGNTYTTEETANHTYNMAVLMFRHTILLRCIWTGKLLENSTLIKFRPKFICYIFSTIIRSNIIHNNMILGFYHLQKISKMGENSDFFFIR